MLWTNNALLLPLCNYFDYFLLLMNIKDILTVRQPMAYFSYSWELCMQNKFKTFLLYGCETANDYKNNSVGNSRSKEASITDSWKLKVHVFCSHGENAKKSNSCFKKFLLNWKALVCVFTRWISLSFTFGNTRTKVDFFAFRVCFSCHSRKKSKNGERTQFNYNCW